MQNHEKPREYCIFLSFFWVFLVFQFGVFFAFFPLEFQFGVFFEFFLLFWTWDLTPVTVSFEFEIVALGQAHQQPLLDIVGESSVYFDKGDINDILPMNTMLWSTNTLCRTHVLERDGVDKRLLGCFKQLPWDRISVYHWPTNHGQVTQENSVEWLVPKEKRNFWT